MKMKVVVTMIVHNGKYENEPNVSFPVFLVSLGTMTLVSFPVNMFTTFESSIILYSYDQFGFVSS